MAPSSQPVDQEQAQRVPNQTRSRSRLRGSTQRGAKGELLTDRASMVEYLLDTHCHRGWCPKLEINHPEPLLLATPGKLADLRDQHTQDSKQGGHQTCQSTTTPPPKTNENHKREHGNHHLVFCRTPLRWGESDCPPWSNFEVEHQDGLLRAA